MHYYLLIALQVFCLYHIYKNHKPYYWFFVIFFIPIAGAIFYIITQVLTNNDVNTIQKEITSIVNPTKKIKDLEKKIEFADTYANRMDLADAYFEIKAYQNAISNYEITLKDKSQNALYAHQQLVLCYFQMNDFNKVISHANEIKDKPEFKGSKQQFCYGLALREKGDLELAERELKAIDRPYSNYNERLELAKFYLENDRREAGKEILKDISNEAQHMTKPNRKLFRQTITEVEQLLKTL
ncbi:hypothetical protein DFQ05_2173 [Winogradskyella wandonensis]|uniref:Tetratricopeptide repeat protein n=1 Tax=Winogradskyella wandonensis TaxID=1442586 RepID=A0A4R1KQW8_9FLAO|nr:hypothetical protein [Winogradskyella wandonensis]TCK66887.1 hypothetical protein DFQ05_2173 [Winogradskyella wandonensis]